MTQGLGPSYTPNPAPTGAMPTLSPLLSGGTNYGQMQQYGSGIPYASEYGGYGAFPAQANAAFNAQNPGMDFAGGMQNFSQGVGAFTSLAQIYGMFQSLGLQKKAFKFAQEGTKRNFNAQATAYNDAVASKETARRASTADRGQDYSSLYAYGTGEKVAKWT